MDARHHRPQDRGAALVLVLTTVAIMGILALAVAEAARFGIRRTANQIDQSQLSWMFLGAETFAAARIRAIGNGDPQAWMDASTWQDRPVAFPLDDGVLTITLSDGGNCFNINSLVSVDEGGQVAANPAARVQLARLIDLVGVRGAGALSRVAAIADWIDPDAEESPGGAEAEAYRSAGLSVRPPNTPMSHTDELALVMGFSASDVQALRPYLCARPAAFGVSVNPNTMNLDQAPILSGIVGPSLPLTQAQALLRGRPRDGWKDLDAFLAEPALQQAQLSDAARVHFILRPRFVAVHMRLQSTGRFGPLDETGMALFDTLSQRIVRRSMGAIGTEGGL